MAFRTNKTPVLQTKSASGAVASFNTALAMPLPSCNIAVNAWQEGSGDPSPSNVRAIHGFSEVNVTANEVLHTIQLGQEVYGAEVDVVNGVAHVEYALVDLGSLSWTYIALRKAFRSVADIFTDESVNDKSICSEYKRYKYSTFINDNTLNYSYSFGSGASYMHKLIMRNLNFDNETDFKNSLNGVYLTYRIAEPFDIQLTPTQIETLIGNNTISADTGNIKVSYRHLPIDLI